MSDDRGPRVVGVVASLAGLGIILGAIFASGEGMNAPRWVIGLIGACFLLAGILALMQGRPGASERIAAAFVFLIVLCFAIVANWAFLFAARPFALSAFFLDAFVAFLVLVFLRARFRRTPDGPPGDGTLMLAALGIAAVALALTAWLAWREPPPAPLPEAPPVYR